MVLFVAAGVGNGSTFRMIPIIFRTLREGAVTDPNDQAALEQARRIGSTEGAATLAACRTFISGNLDYTELH